MSQEKIVKLLEKETKPLSRAEICEKLGLDKTKVSHNIKCLLKYNEIKCIEIDRNQAREFYGKKYGHRMRLYYL